jgi:hypothetical protein
MIHVVSQFAGFVHSAICEIGTMSFFSGRGPRLWGDYGSILIHGMTAHLPKKDNRLQLERTGPFMPPITFPGLGDVVVKDDFRIELMHSPFAHLVFCPVVKARIVEYHWEKWDRTAPEAQEYPESGEPEDYILFRPHSPETAEALGNTWQVILPEGATVDTDSRRAPWDYDIRVHASTWNGNHLFWGRKRSENSGSWIIVTDTGKKWLEERAEQWLRFEACLEK